MLVNQISEWIFFLKIFEQFSTWKAHLSAMQIDAKGDKDGEDIAEIPNE